MQQAQTNSKQGNPINTWKMFKTTKKNASKNDDTWSRIIFQISED